MNMYRMKFKIIELTRTPMCYVVMQACIYKEGVSRTVVREALPRATAHGHQTFPDYERHTRSPSSQCITSWGLSSNGITSLCPTSWHMPSTHGETCTYGCVKMFPPKTRADVRMVQCVPARYGKATRRKNRSNKEEGQFMQRGGTVGPCNKEEGRSIQNPGH